MKNLLREILIVSFGIIAVLFILNYQNSNVVQGSTDNDVGSYSTTTVAGFGTSNKILKNGRGVLTNINVGLTGTGIITIYDATTTDKTLRTNTATTTLAVVDSSKSIVSLPYDSTASYGILVEISNAAVGSTTITWK